MTRSRRPGKSKPKSIHFKLSDFKKVPKDSYGFENAWRYKEPIKTSVGKFGLEFFMTYDPQPPDAEMVRLAGDLVQYAQSHSEYIRDIIHGHYRYYVTEYGPDSLFSDMPADLKPKQIWKYCDPLLVVERNPKEDFVGPPYSCRIVANPEWEPEHNLSLEFSNGTIVTVNQGPFQILEGILRGEI